MLYVRLFHGRTDPKQDLDNWGSDGPVFGSYKFAHMTYVHVVRLGKDDDSCDELFYFEDMLYYDGVYYGDWSVLSYEEYLKNDEFVTENFDQAKAKIGD